MIYQEQIFTKEECNEIVQYSKIYTNVEGYYTDKVKIINNRLTSLNGGFGYNVYVILNDEKTKWFFDKLLTWFSLVSKIQIHQNEKIDFCSLHCYIKGDRFPRHIDLNNGYTNRRYNLGIQLNNDYEGGEYVCLDKNENEILISKETGTALSYHCSVPHEIK